MRKIGLFEVFVFKKRNKHCGNTVEAGYLFFVDAIKRTLGRKIGKRRHGNRMGNRSGHCKHHAEAVEHGNLNHHSVGTGKIHSVADVFAVVNNVIVCQHNALGESGRSRGVLHVANVVLVNKRSAAVNLFDRGLFGKFKRLLPGQTALLLALNRNNVAKEGKTLCIKRLARLVCFKLGAELVDYCVVIAVLISVAHNERVRVGLAEQIFELVYFISGVYRNQNRADFCCCPERDIPLRQVGRPNGNVVAALNTERNKRACEFVNVIAELRVGSRIIAFGEAEGILIGEGFANFVEHLREGKVDKHILLPDIFALTAQIVDECVVIRDLARETSHIVDVVRENDARILKIGCPTLNPFKRKESVKVYRAEREDHVVDRHVSFAHKLINDLTVFFNAVLNVNVGDIHTKVLNRCFGRFLGEAVGVVNIPKCRNAVAFNSVKNRFKPCRIAVNAVGLDNERNARFLCNGRKRCKLAQYLGIVYLAVGLGKIIAENANEFCSQRFSGGDIFGYYLFVFFGSFGVF